jgi:hypothetical protein
MKPIDLKDVAKDLAAAAKFYIEDAIKDRTGGMIRTSFKCALHERGMDGITELSMPMAPVFTNPGNDGTAIMKLGDNEYLITRVVTAIFKTDVEDVRLMPHTVMDAIRKAVTAYVSAFDGSVAAATVPALFVEAKAFHLEWMLWGYAGTEVQRKKGKKRKQK